MAPPVIPPQLNVSLKRDYFLWLIVASFCIGILLGRGPLSGREPHYLFVYPDKENLNRYMECGAFKSIDEARVAANSWLRLFPEGDYEIGIGDPKLMDGTDIKVFKETVK